MDVVNTRLPSSAIWLGGLGAIPFVGLAVAIPLVSDGLRPVVVHALAAYGATILSFLGGVHWGLAMGSASSDKSDELWTRLTISVIPPLAGWAALVVAGRLGLCILAAAIAAMLWVDLRATRLGQAPPWYPNLRIPLTCTVAGALLVGAVFY